ncbi:MAG: helix-turn-helix domain-containing protein [Microbacteriaceae bacterium]
MRATRWFQPFEPSPQARSVLTCVWTARFHGAHLLVPDGSMDIVWIEGRGLHLCGPDTRSWRVSLPPSTDCVGARFRPGAAATALRIHADDLLDQRVPLDAVIGSRRARLVDEQIADARPGAPRLRHLERLATQLSGPPENELDRSVFGAVAALGVADRRVDELAHHAGLSPRQLQRRFVRHVGYPPSQFARIARLQRFLHHSVIDPDASLAAVAASTGYSDQSHLARDCRSIAGLTPSELRAMVDITSHAPSTPLPDVRSVQAAVVPTVRRSAA